MEQSPEVPAPRKRRAKDGRASAMVTSGELSAEGRLRRAGWRRGETGFATGGNATNPRIGSGMKQACKAREEQTVEVVRNHGDGTREGVATLPEGRASVREWILSPVSMEGRSLDNPRRGNPALRCRVARTGRCRERRHEGQEGRAFPHCKVGACGPVEGPSRAGMRKCPKAVEGGGEGQPSHDFDRVFPPREASRQTGCRARTLRRRALGDERRAPG